MPTSRPPYSVGPAHHRPAVGEQGAPPRPGAASNPTAVSSEARAPGAGTCACQPGPGLGPERLLRRGEGEVHAAANLAHRWTECQGHDGKPAVGRPGGAVSGRTRIRGHNDRYAQRRHRRCGTHPGGPPGRPAVGLAAVDLAAQPLRALLGATISTRPWSRT